MAKVSELHHTKRSSQHYVSNKSFFDGLVGRAKTAAMLMANKRANKMQQILVHRWLLGSAANGRFPRWDGSNGIPSLKSFSKWTVKPNGDEGFILFNDATDSKRSGGQGFNYPQLLISGKGWREGVGHSSGKPLANIQKKLVRGPSGGLFSTQMPKGLDPWLKTERKLLEKDIKEAFRSIT